MSFLKIQNALEKNSFELETVPYNFLLSVCGPGPSVYTLSLKCLWVFDPSKGPIRHHSLWLLSPGAELEVFISCQPWPTSGFP